MITFKDLLNNYEYFRLTHNLRHPQLLVMSPDDRKDFFVSMNLAMETCQNATDYETAVRELEAGYSPDVTMKFMAANVVAGDVADGAWRFGNESSVFESVPAAGALNHGEYRHVPVSEEFPDEQPSPEPPAVGVARPFTDEPSFQLASAMTPAIDPDDFDNAVEEVARTLESPVEWVTVASKNLAAVAYQEDLKLLLVEFKKGDVYSYAGVPPEVYKELVEAESKGGYHYSNIRNVYPCEKVETK